MVGRGSPPAPRRAGTPLRAIAPPCWVLASDDYMLADGRMCAPPWPRSVPIGGLVLAFSPTKALARAPAGWPLHLLRGTTDGLSRSVLRITMEEPVAAALGDHGDAVAEALDTLADADRFLRSGASAETLRALVDDHLRALDLPAASTVMVDAAPGSLRLFEPAYVRRLTARTSERTDVPDGVLDRAASLAARITAPSQSALICLLAQSWVRARAGDHPLVYDPLVELMRYGMTLHRIVRSGNGYDVVLENVRGTTPAPIAHAMSGDDG